MINNKENKNITVSLYDVFEAIEVVEFGYLIFNCSALASQICGEIKKHLIDKINEGDCE